MPQALAINQFTGPSAGTFVKAIFACNGDIQAAYELVGYNASLPRQTWEQIASRISAESQKRLVGVNDIRSRPSLLETVAIATTVHLEPIESDLAPARQAMNTMVTPEMADIQFNNLGLPLPMVFVDTQMDMRTMGAPLPGGQNLRTRWATVATQKVSEAHELNLFNGNTNIGAQDEQGNLHVIRGYTTHPQRNVVGNPAPWADFAAINNAFQAMISAMRNNFFYGPYIFYVAPDIWTILQGRNTAASERAFSEILKDSPEIEDIKFTHDLAAQSMIGVSPDPDVVMWIQSADIQASDWDAMGIFGTNVRTWSIAAPHVKATYSGRSGISHMTGITTA